MRNQKWYLFNVTAQTNYRRSCVMLLWCCLLVPKRLEAGVPTDSLPLASPLQHTPRFLYVGGIGGTTTSMPAHTYYRPRFIKNGYTPLLGFECAVGVHLGSELLQKFIDGSLKIGFLNRNTAFRKRSPHGFSSGLLVYASPCSRLGARFVLEPRIGIGYGVFYLPDRATIKHETPYYVRQYSPYVLVGGGCTWRILPHIMLVAHLNYNVLYDVQRNRYDIYREPGARPDDATDNPIQRPYVDNLSFLDLSLGCGYTFYPTKFSFPQKPHYKRNSVEVGGTIGRQQLYPGELRQSINSDLFGDIAAVSAGQIQILEQGKYFFAGLHANYSYFPTRYWSPIHLGFELFYDHATRSICKQLQFPTRSSIKFTGYWGTTLRFGRLEFSSDLGLLLIPSLTDLLGAAGNFLAKDQNQDDKKMVRILKAATFLIINRNSISWQVFEHLKLGVVFHRSIRLHHKNQSLHDFSFYNKQIGLQVAYTY